MRNGLHANRTVISTATSCVLLAASMAALGAAVAGPAATAERAGTPGLGTPHVRVESGLLGGVERDGVLVFRGVPFAAPPVGDLRWRPPQPPLPWSGERRAERPGPACMQQSESVGAVSEDCLSLQVFAPKGVASAPVMVYLHGGSNSAGSSSLGYFDGTPFARDGVVLVAPNYRLGALGFFAHPALTGAAPPGEPLADFGLMDQLAALRWVARNVEAFGGDPKRVTLFGESAGATDVLALLAAPAARGLFAQAIVESPPGGWDPWPSLEEAETEGVSLAGALRLKPPVTAVALRAVPAKRLVDAERFFVPVRDGRLLPESPAAAFAGGRAAHLPLILGSNSDEASLLGDPARLVHGVGPALLAAYAADGPDARAQGAALFNDRNFAGPVRWFARRAAPLAPTWLYHFSYVRERQRRHVPGAAHGSELPYVFDSWDKISPRVAGLSAEDRAMSAMVHGLWVAFAKTGVPAAPNVPAWPPYTEERDELMELDRVPAVVGHFRQRQLDAQEISAGKRSAPAPPS
ncbi:MAG: carboxylesterase/lipase family protein [Acidobacteria bacterium]|nr:carboxylesterase/lipase family protein [Acidobacteriota bacterium]